VARILPSGRSTRRLDDPEIPRIGLKGGRNINPAVGPLIVLHDGDQGTSDRES